MNILEENLNSSTLHEIHISVDPSQIFLLRKYCAENKIKPILACSLTGDHKNQLMISKWKANMSDKDVILYAIELAEKMKSYGLIVDRTKVEAMAKETSSGGKYFEFHLKADYNSFDKIIEMDVIKHYKCGVSVSAFKEKLTKCLITLRVDGSLKYSQAKEYCDNLINTLNAKEIYIDNFFAKEYAIYDDNISYDNNWLDTYTADLKNF